MIRIEAISSFRQLGPRNNQEDYILPSSPTTDDHILVLCDGMGGHGHGEVASETVAMAVFQYLGGMDIDLIGAADLQAAVDTASATLFSHNIVDSERTMGTTLVVAIIKKASVLIAHVGDSRAYLFDRSGRRKFRTTDHSRVAEAVANEILTEEEAFNSPYKNQITRALMADREHVAADVDELAIANGDILMLCSDGVNDCLRDNQIAEAFVAFDFEEACKAIGRQCDASSHDNNTAIFALLSNDEATTTQEQHTETTDYRHDAANTGTECRQSKFCPNCGTELDACVNFCPNCGQKISRRTTCRICGAIDQGLGLIENGIKTLRRKIRGNDV